MSTLKGNINIATLIEVLEDAAHVILVMAYQPGGDLFDLIKRNGTNSLK